MSVISFGDLAQSFMLKTSIKSLNAKSSEITAELTNGVVNDTAAAVDGDFTALAAIQRVRLVNKAYLSVASEAAFEMKAMQNVFSHILEAGRSLANDLSLGATNNTPEGRDLIAERGRASLQSAISNINARAGGKSLFGGVQTDGAAIADADVILSALRAATTGATSADDIITKINTWFDDPAGYETIGYLGGAPKQDLRISDTETVPRDITANNDGIKDMLKGFATAALLTDASFTITDTERSALTQKAAGLMIAGNDDLVGLSARLGLAQEKVDAVITRGKAEDTVFEMAEADITATDPYKLATELEAISTNLQMLFQVTARLSRLNLSDYLR